MGNRSGAVRANVLAVATLAAVVGASSAPAADPEVRTFAVAVDGKPSGSLSMTCRPAADGSESVEVVSEVKVRVLLVAYRYGIRSTEVWKGGRLTAVSATTDDNGRVKRVRAVPAGDGLAVTANGRTRAARADALTSTGWRFPPAGAQTVSVLDVEEGTETDARVTALGDCRVTVGGQAIEGKKYKLTGRGLDAEWWFDTAGRPVRQSLVSDGHEIVLTLTGVGRP